MLDLCDFAETGLFLCLGAYGNNVVVPFEQCPHFTIKYGFVGKTLFVQALIKIGNETSAPSPYHCQLLKDDRTIVLMQSTNGWTNASLTTAYIQLQLDHQDVPLGPDTDGKSRPKVINFDGHAAHIYNDDFAALFEKNDILGLSPTAHTSAPSTRLPGTQQMDYPAAAGGGIARFKGVFRPKMRKQFGSALRAPQPGQSKGHVSLAEVLTMAEESINKSWDPSKIEKLNESVGYYINKDGYDTPLHPHPP
jgi:hypothetical protein